MTSFTTLSGQRDWIDAEIERLVREVAGAPLPSLREVERSFLRCLQVAAVGVAVVAWVVKLLVY